MIGWFLAGVALWCVLARRPSGPNDCLRCGARLSTRTGERVCDDCLYRYRP